MSDMMVNRRKVLLGAGALGASIAFPAVVRAKSYASKPIRMIVGNSAGGSNDILARLIAPIMSEELGQPITVENRPGAAGSIGMAAAMNSPADGHTLFCSSMAIIATKHTYAKKAADPVTDLEHITTIGSGDFTFTVNSDVPARDYEEFVALARSQLSKLKVGSPGLGGDIHLVGELFKIRAGVNLDTVHYSQVGNLVNDLLTNQIQLGINAIRITAVHIKAGKLRPLFVASTEREPMFPDTPTSIELGLKDMHKISSCFGLHAPKGTPPEIVEQLNKAAVSAINASKERMIGAGYKPIGDTPASFRERINDFDRIFAEVAQTAKVRVE
jgi:tripartite-type tricarboxylate transporter receptor subunit TctC